MRRIVALIVIALLGATLYGFSNSSSGIQVNGETLSNSTVRAELAAISTNTNVECYITALSRVNFARGAGGASIASTGASAWANLRVEGLAIDQYAKRTLHFRPTAASLALAKTSLESELTQAVAQIAATQQFGCPGSAAQALASMPPEMRAAEIEAQDASVFLISQLNSTITINAASLQEYYTSHAKSYDTICVSAALVLTSQVSAFNAAEAGGMTIAALAKKYSQDPGSASKGGALGCYSPSSSSYLTVRNDTQNAPFNAFSTSPIRYDATHVLYLAITKRTTTPYALAASAVLTDVESANATTANKVKSYILAHAAVSVDPAFGRWGLSSTGPSVFALATPSTSSVGSTLTISALTKASVSSYK